MREYLDARWVNGWARTEESGLHMSSSGSVDIVGIYDGDRTRRMQDRVAPRHIAHIWAGVTRAGEASRRPYEEKFKCHTGPVVNLGPLLTAV